MATDYQALIIPIGLDVSQFDKSIKEVMAGFREISKEIKATPADRLTEETKKTYQELKRTVDLLQSNAFDLPGDKLADSSKKARTALTNLNLVVQDLPFGFIGIQNNLPGLITSFRNLSEESKTSGGIFKALTEQIKGPGGAFLAFTLVTSAVTFLTKEYGSLGNAMKALIGNEIDPLVFKTQELDKAFKEYTKSIKSNAEVSALAVSSNAGLLQTVSLLSQSATDLSKSEQERGKYLDKLKEIDKSYFGNLDTGKTSIDKINEATKKYTESLVAQSTVKAYQSQLDAIEAQIAPLKVLRDDLKANLEIAKVQDKLNSKIIEQAAKLGGGAAPNLGDPIGKANKALDENAIKLEELFKQRDKFISGLTDSIKVWKEFKYSTDNATESVEKFKFSLPKTGEFLLSEGYFIPQNALKRLEDYANVLLDVKASEKDRSKALEGLSSDYVNYIQGVDLSKLSYNQLEDAIVKYGYTLQDIILYEKRLAEIRKNRVPAQNMIDDYFESFKKRFKEGENPFESFLGQFNDEFTKRISKDLVDSYTNLLKSLSSKEFQQRAIQNVTLKTDVVPVDFDQINKGLKIIDEETKKITDSWIKASSSLQDILEKTFFDLLDTGAANWKAFADAVIKELKRIIATLAIKALVENLANLFAPGSGFAVGKALESIPTDELGAYLDQFGGMSANFGGIRGTGYEMNGAVNLTLRGNDLVGSINRTNTSIRRIG
jgi:polyhydroxyalkanoate synthesis regulator phasin